MVAGTQVNHPVITAVDNPVIGTSRDVQTGSSVHAIYLKLEVNATSSAALSNFYLAVFKNPGQNLANIAPNAVGINDDKRYVIHQEMVMLQQVTNSNPRTVFNGVIMIPRGYQRMGPNDSVTLNLLAPGTNMNFCLQCHYKEFR